MAHHKKTRIRCRSAKRKRHRKSKRVCCSDRGTCLERAKHLYIIGNGFDLHHHIPSSYNDFKEWLEDNDIDTLYKVENILETDEPKWWNEFETNLGKPFAVKLYAPADTENIPILRKKDRKKQRMISYIVVSLMMILANLINNRIISNMLIWGALVQSISICKFTYNFFRVKYGYLEYLKTKKDAV
jgi:hypothetical protein